MRIINLEEYYNGWKWQTVSTTDLLFLEKLAVPLTTDYRTSKDGDGLFRGTDRGDWIQELGTTQFSLTPHDKKKARRAIRYYFTGE